MKNKIIDNNMEIKICDYTPKKDIYYRVENGDTFENISSLFNVPKDYIVFHNNNDLYVGKVLYLPEIDLISYVVKPFDTLEKISKNYGKTVQEIKEKNNIINNYIFVGQKLYL